MRREGKETCQLCRTRKVRCDGNKPSCDRCVQYERPCKYVNPRASSVSFRYSKLSALAVVALADRQHQRESDTSGSPLTSAVDEHSNDGVDEFRNPNPFSSALPLPQSGPHMIASPEAQSVHTIHSLSSPSTNFTQPFSSIQAYLHYGSPVSPQASQSSHGESVVVVPNNAASSSNVSYYRDVPRRLTSLEGDLLHFYVQNIGPWLDVTSPERHYTYTVPRLSLHCSLLLYAIVACSAHILRVLDETRISELTDSEEKYQSECVRLLIPVLDYAVEDEAVLATIIILRMLEQYDEYHTDRQCHLVPGAFAQFSPVGTIPSSTGLGGLYQAAFYSYVRADIRMAILGQCGTKISVDSWPLNENAPSSDADWANCMTWLLVHVINLCYGSGDSVQRGVLPYDELARRIDAWKENVPKTFEPYFYEEMDRELFPVVRLLCPWHVVGLQFYHASKILLATHNPPDALFSNALDFNKHVEAKILMHVRMLCAISFSNDHYGCRINASHLIAMGARFFTGREEQWRVQDYFNMLQNEKGWPSRACQEMLQGAWSRE